MSIAFFAHCGTRQSHTLSSGTRELQSICTLATLAKFGSRKTKLDPWSVGCQSQRGCLRKLRNNSAKGQHEYLVSAAFAFNFRWIAVSGLYGHSPPSDQKPATSKSLHLDSCGEICILGKRASCSLRTFCTDRQELHCNCAPAMPAKFKTQFRKNQSLTLGL